MRNKLLPCLTNIVLYALCNIICIHVRLFLLLFLFCKSIETLKINLFRIGCSFANCKAMKYCASDSKIDGFSFENTHLFAYRFCHHQFTLIIATPQSTSTTHCSDEQRKRNTYCLLLKRSSILSHYVLHFIDFSISIFFLFLCIFSYRYNTNTKFKP